MAAVTLAEVKESIKEQTPFLETTANGIRAIEQFIIQNIRQEGDREEIRREELQAASRITPSSLVRENQITNLSGVGGTLAAPLIGLGAAMAGGGALLSGLGIAGAGIGAFFVELSVAEAIMSKFGNGENLRALLTNLAEGLGAFGTQEIIALGGLFAGASIFGAVAGTRRGARGALGIAVIGAGIAAFFTELAIADAAISKWGGDGAALSLFMGNIANALEKLTTLSGGALAGLFVAGGLFGVVGGVGRTARATVGIAAVGAGIAAFFSALAAGDMAIEAMQATGASLKVFITNLVEGISAFTPEAAAVIGGLIATGGIFGPSMIGAAVGMGAMGAGIGFFFAGIAAGDVGISALNKLAGTQPGEGFKNLLVNTAVGIEKFANIDIDPQKVSNLSSALNSVSLAIVGFFGADSIGKLKGLSEELAAGLGGVFDTIFGTNFAGEAKKGAIERIIEAMEPIKTLPDETITKLNLFSAAIGNVASSFSTLAGIKAEGMTVNLEKMLRGVGAILDAKEKLLYGGSYRPPAGGLLGRQDIRFGEEGRGGLVNFSDEEATLMREGVSKLYSGLGLAAPSAAIGVPVQAISDQLENLYVETLTVRQGLSTPIINVFDQSTTGGTTITNSAGGARPQRPIARNPFEFYNRR